MLAYKSPLNWPSAIPATPVAKQRNDSGFSPNITLTEAVTFLDEELTNAGIKQASLSLDVEQPQVERLRKKVGNRTGVVLTVKYKEVPYIIACDRWQKLEHNIYALHLAVRQWGNMEKWGIAPMQKLLAGFSSSFVVADDSEEFELLESFKIFGLGSTATLEDATAIYHRRAKAIGDNNDELVKLNQIMDEIREHFAK